MNNRIRWFNAFLFFNCIALLCSFYVASTSSFIGLGWIELIVSIIFIWLILYVIATYKYFGTIYLYGHTYVLVILLFHYSLLALSVLGYVDLSSWSIGKDAVYFEKSGWLLLISLTAYGMGVYFAARRKQVNVVSFKERQISLFLTKRVMFNFGLGLGLASIIFLIMALKSYGNILSYSRAELFNSSNDSRGFGVFMMVFPGAISLIALSAESRMQKLFAYSLAVLSLVIIMLSGYRSAALFPALVFAVSWVKFGRKIPTYVAVSIVILVLVSIATIGIFRQQGAYQDLNVNQLQESYSNSEFSDSLKEMGSTFVVLKEVVKLIPEYEGYRFGYSYYISGLEMLPNLGGQMDYEKSRGYLASQARNNIDALKYMAPADWITYRLNRWKFENGQGLGFSAIAEPYYNFGYFGSVLFFMLIGYLITRIDILPLFSYPFVSVFMVGVFWCLLRTSRNDFTNFSKPFGFILIICLIWYICQRVIGRRLVLYKDVNI